MRAVLRVGMVVVVLGLVAVPLPSASASHAGDAMLNPLNMAQDLGSRQGTTFNQVLHIATSYYLRFCVQFQGLNCVQYQDNFDWRVAGGWVQRRYDDFWSYSDSGLASATLVQRHQNVLTSYPNNGERNGGNFRYYYYCPLDGSADSATRVGFSYGLDGTPNVGGGYVWANADIPTKMTNHVYRPSGIYLSNSVYATQQFTFGESTSWRWAPVCNAARHYLGQPGWEVRIEIWSESMDVIWDWGCWCFRILRYNDYSDFRMQF